MVIAVEHSESSFGRCLTGVAFCFGILTILLIDLKFAWNPRSKIETVTTKKIAILLIVPDVLYNHIDPEEDLRRAQECWRQNCPVEESNKNLKWALGIILWREISARASLKMKNDAHIFLLRYSISLGHGEVIQHSEGDMISILTFGRMPASWEGTIQATPPILYKSVEALRLLSKQHEYDYFVRGNINIFLNIERLITYLNFLPTTNLYTSPFINTQSYIFGYFILMSSDVASGIVESFDHGSLHNMKLFMNKKYNKSISSAESSDDVDLAILSLGKMFGQTFGKAYAWPLEYQTMIGGDCSHNPRSLSNYLGLRLDNDFEHRGFLLSFDEAVELINNASKTVFLYRMRTFTDKSLVRIYKYLLDTL